MSRISRHRLLPFLYIVIHHYGSDNHQDHENRNPHVPFSFRFAATIRLDQQFDQQNHAGNETGTGKRPAVIIVRRVDPKTESGKNAVR